MAEVTELSSPEPLTAAHDVLLFSCGQASMDTWLIKRALDSDVRDTAKTFVVRRGKRVVGYYALASGSMTHAEASKSLKRNTPDPFPITILARLARDVTEKGNGLGPALLADAMTRAALASKIVAARLLVVHAIDAQAEAFYEKHNFKRLTPGLPTFFMTLKQVRDAL